MRDPDNMHKSYEYVDEVPNLIVIKDLPPYDIHDYDLNDDKEFKKYLYAVEKKVRNSFEYHQMIAYLREFLDMNKCSFYLNVNNINTTKIKIEIHHEPLSLFDIVSIVYNKRAFFNEDLSEEMVAKEVMYHHYNLEVGLIPLAETVHELVHNQYLFVPTTRVLGNYRKFVNDYGQFMSPEQKDCLERIEQASDLYEDDYKDILSKKYIYVDMSGAFNLPRTEDIINMIKGRINDLVNNPPPQTSQLAPRSSDNLIDPFEPNIH
jgi:hypothetical protein